jgi:hypothetical protein
MKKGDIVKSLDFHHIDDCYYLGKVVSVSKIDGTFRAETIERVWQGKVVPPKDSMHSSDYFVAPLPGKSFLDGTGYERVRVVG